MCYSRESLFPVFPCTCSRWPVLSVALPAGEKGDPGESGEKGMRGLIGFPGIKGEIGVPLSVVQLLRGTQTSSVSTFVAQTNMTHRRLVSASFTELFSC